MATNTASTTATQRSRSRRSSSGRCASPIPRRGRRISRPALEGLLQDHLVDQYWKTEFVDRHVGATLRGLYSPIPIHRSSASSTACAVPVAVRRPCVAWTPPRRPSTSRSSPRQLARVPAAPPPVPPAGARLATAAGPTVADPPKVVGERDAVAQVQLARTAHFGGRRSCIYLKIEHKYKGTLLTARIEGADQIVFGDTVAPSRPSRRWQVGIDERQDELIHRRTAGRSGIPGRRRLTSRAGEGVAAAAARGWSIYHLIDQRLTGSASVARPTSMRPGYSDLEQETECVQMTEHGRTGCTVRPWQSASSWRR